MADYAALTRKIPPCFQSGFARFQAVPGKVKESICVKIQASGKTGTAVYIIYLCPRVDWHIWAPGSRVDWHICVTNLTQFPTDLSVSHHLIAELPSLTIDRSVRLLH